MPKKPVIGLLSPFFQPIPGYEAAANALNLNLLITNPNKIAWKTLQVRGLLWNGQNWITKAVKLPPVFYNRYYGPKPKVVDELEVVIGKNRVFNHITRFDKWEIHKILNKSPLKQFLPVTSLYTRANLVSYLDQYQQVILKPKDGQLGRQVYLLKRMKEQYFVYQTTNYPSASFTSKSEFLNHVATLATKGFLLQEFIPLASLEGRIFDLRFLVQKNGQGIWQVSGTLGRLALGYSYLTNLAPQIKSVQAILTELFPGMGLFAKLEDISLKGAQLVEKNLGSLGELSVDFGLDSQGQIWLIELNSKPMKIIFQELNDQATFRRIYQLPLEYARFLTTT